MVSRKVFIAVVALATLCGACGSLIPVSKVSAPPSVSDSDMNKANADCAKPAASGAASSGSAAAGDCKPQTKH